MSILTKPMRILAILGLLVFCAGARGAASQAAVVLRTASAARPTPVAAARGFVCVAVSFLQLSSWPLWHAASLPSDTLPSVRFLCCDSAICVCAIPESAAACRCASLKIETIFDIMNFCAASRTTRRTASHLKCWLQSSHRILSAICNMDLAT